MLSDIAGRPTRAMANWAAGGAAVKGAWAVHGGRLGRVGTVYNAGQVQIVYADGPGRRAPP
jgi:hypothetical protein